MDKIRFKGKRIQTGIQSTVMFEARDNEDELGHFVKEMATYEARQLEMDPGYEIYWDVELKRWYHRRTLKANNLAWELATRLAQVDGIKKEVVYYAIKELTDLPRDEYKGVFVQRASADLNSVDFAKLIENLVIECQTHDPPVDILDIYILFTQWRFGQEKDPLEGTYGSKKDYREKHPCCEACGKFLLYTDNSGVQAHAGECAHIVSAGSGGKDTDYNWLLLCANCHRDLQHQKGWDEFIKLYPHLETKISRARERSGKKPINQNDDETLQGEAEMVDDFEDDIPWEDNQPETALAVRREETQEELVRRVFDGSEVGKIATSEAPVGQSGDKKEKMMDRIKDMEKTASDSKSKYYSEPDPQQMLFDEKPEPVKDDNELEIY